MATKIHPLVAISLSLILFGITLNLGSISSSIIDFSSLSTNSLNLIKIGGLILSMWVIIMGGMPEDS